LSSIHVVTLARIYKCVLGVAEMSVGTGRLSVG
jgi:hypothetical protein